MLKRTKIKVIQSAPELLRVKSRYQKPTDVRRNIMIAIIIIPFVLYLSIMMYVLNQKSIEERFAFIFATLMLLGIALFVFFTTYRRRGCTFIITEKGLFAEPGIAEYWEDIESYVWEEFIGTINKTDFSASNYGICLLIYTKSLFNKNISSVRGLFPHAMLAQYGIFFSPDQVEEANKIFQKYGIEKKSI